MSLKMLIKFINYCRSFKIPNKYVPKYFNDIYQSRPTPPVNFAHCRGDIHVQGSKPETKSLTLPTGAHKGKAGTHER